MMRLHGYFRSSAAYRVRVALAFKGVAYDGAFHSLRDNEHLSPAYRAINPQGLVPALEVDAGEGDGQAGVAVLTQSLAICEYIDETGQGPRLLPEDPLMRARVRAAAQVIACDVHPLQNLRVLRWLRELGQDQAGVDAWAGRVIGEGLDAFDALIAPFAGRFCFGGGLTLADVCLVPQLVNARRFGMDVARWPRLLAIEAACLAHPAFIAAAPGDQPDAAP